MRECLNILMYSSTKGEESTARIQVNRGTNEKERRGYGEDKFGVIGRPHTHRLGVGRKKHDHKKMGAAQMTGWDGVACLAPCATGMTGGSADKARDVDMEKAREEGGLPEPRVRGTKGV